MKRICLFSMLFLAIFSGCTKDNRNGTIEGISGFGIAINSGEQLSEELGFMVKSSGVNWSSDFKPTKDDFTLHVYGTTDGNAYRPDYDTQEEIEAYRDWQLDLINNGLDKECPAPYDWYYHYYYAGIAEGAKIYADKTLWRREPGEDLGDMFSIPFTKDDVIVTYPEFYVLYGRHDKHPDTFRELMSNRIALNSSNIVSLTFAEIPPEELGTVTFTVEIPVDVEYYEDYSPEMYELHPTLKPEGRRLLKGSVTVEFAPAD